MDYIPCSKYMAVFFRLCLHVWSPYWFRFVRIKIVEISPNN